MEAQVLNLLRYLKDVFNLTYVFISHDLNVVQYVSDRVLVMYLGEVVEIGPVDKIYANPKHPYTAALGLRLSMNPDDRVNETDRQLAIRPIRSTPFRLSLSHPCEFAEKICEIETPALPQDVGPMGHACACHMFVANQAIQKSIMHAAEDVTPSSPAESPS